MIYYLIFLICAILMDIKDLKNTMKKSDVIFYIISIILTIGLATIYYINMGKIGIADYVINFFGLKGV